MKLLIVNGDDFGASHGINLAVIRAHREGLLTSASMMVDRPGSVEAAELAAAHPALGMGLHVELDHADGGSFEASVERQLERFLALTGGMPTHLDTHRNAHRDDYALPAFVAIAERHELPLRGHCGVHHITCFYGQWDGESHLEQIGPAGLVRILETEVREGVNELCCHPGYVDAALRSSYRAERETELETLCDPALAALVAGRGIRLVTFRELPGR